MTSFFAHDHKALGTDGPRMEVIRSSANPLIKRIRSLQRRKARHQERAFVVEGFRAVADVLSAGVQPEMIVLREDSLDQTFLQMVEEKALPWRAVDVRLFESLTDQPHPQGVLALVPMLEYAEIPTLDSKASPLIMLLDGVRDPGNLGTLLRSAAGAGVDHVFLSQDTVDPYNPRAVRAAMGAHFRVSFSQITPTKISDVLSSAGTVGLAEADGDVDYDAVDWTRSAVIIVGGEANGASSLVREMAPMKVRIPLASDVESLNAAVAGSLLVFEAARQRRRVNYGRTSFITTVAESS